MPVTIEGPLADFATALGIMAGGELNAAWFADPGKYAGAMLREPEQRDALLRAANELLERGAPALDDEAGRRWIRVLERDAVTLAVVITGGTGATEIGIGARVQATGPDARVVAYVPLLRVPSSGPVVTAFDPTGGASRILAEAEVVFNPAAPAPGEAALAGLRLSASVGTTGAAPRLDVTLLGLQLPGQDAPADVSLGGDDPEELAGQALRLLLGMLREAASGASSELAEILSLLGISADPHIPPLPVAQLFTDGLPAWRGWLDALLADDAAVGAWLAHLAQLAGNGAAVVGAAAPGLPHRVEWALAGGAKLAAALRVFRTPAGAPAAELGLQASLSTPGTASTPPGALEASATLVRVTLGATPAIAGLPRLEVAGRIGPAQAATPADRLLDVATPVLQVGSLRAGIGMGEDRRAGFVLAAHDVVIGTHPYPVLDLTNPQTLADVAGSAVDDLATAVLDRLGPAGPAVRVLLGLSPPPGAGAWPVALTPLPALLADPVAALLDYHARVLAEHRSGYAAVLEPLRALLAGPGPAVPVTGTGDEDTPWRLELAAGAALVAWTAGTTLELGVVIERSVVDLGGGCPTADLRIVARLASLSLSGGGGHAFPGALARLTFGARGGVPLRIGVPDAAIVADRAGVELRWTPQDGVRAALSAPGLAAVVDGEPVPFALPTLAADGTLAGEVPWRALELLLGHVLGLLGDPWADRLARLSGWAPGGGTAAVRLPLESLVEDPAAALRAWAAALVEAGEVAELARALALAVTGPALPGVSAGTFRGRGDAASPFAVALSGAAAAAARRVEVLLWARSPDGSLLSWAPAGETGGGAAGVAAALQAAAAAGSRALADALLDRGGVAAGLAALAARWADTDGLVRAADAVLPGAAVHEVAGAAHGVLREVDLAALTGVAPGPGAVVALGPLGGDAWPGIDADHVLDLRAPGLVPEAFDMAGPAGEDGPWLVLLPGRADAAAAPGDDGAALQAARLARVVSAVSTRLAGSEPVAVIGYGAAGHAAAAVAGVPGVTHLVTVGTPHGGVGLDVLEQQPVAGALRLLAGLLPPAGPDDALTEDEARGRGLLDALAGPYEAATSPLADLAPPSAAPVVPAGVEAHCVRGRCDAASVSAAVAALGARVLEDAAVAAAGGTPGEAEGAAPLGVGLNVAIDPPASSGELHVTVELALTAQLLSASARPAVRARVGIGRAGGWLAGGPDPARPAGVARHPSLRRAEVEVELGADGAASARLIFHEASALGVSRTRWVVAYGGGGDPLLPEAAVLVGRLAAALGPLPASGTVLELARLLDALGLVEPAGGAVPGALFGLSVDGVRRLLVDPAGLFADAVSPAGAPAVAAALAALLGAPAPAAAAPAVVVAQLDGVTLRADLAARTLRAEAAALATDAGATVAALVELRADGTLAVQGSAAFGAPGGPNGRPVLEVSGPPLQARVRWEGAGGVLGQPVQLAPVPDEAAVARLLVAAVPAYVLWAGITFVRTLQPGAVALIDPVLRALGLLTGTGPATRVVIPLALLDDPAGWLAHALAPGGGGTDLQRLRDVLDAVAVLLGIPQPGPGAWTLPYGLELAADVQAGRAALGLRLDEPVAGTGLRVAGRLGVALGGPGVAATPTAELTLGVLDALALADSGRVTLTVGPAGAEGRLILPSSLDLRLFPDGPGLADAGAAAAAAVTYALPLVLDAVAGLTPPHRAAGVGAALAALGDALALRSGGNFVAAELAALAANPGAELATRLQQALQPALTALAALLQPSLPAGYSLAVVGSDLVFQHTVGVTIELHLTVPTGGSQGVKLTGTVGGIHPFTGATIDGTLKVDPGGLAEARVAFAVDPANGIALGPVTLAPLAMVVIGNNPAGGARVAVGLADTTGSVSGVLHLNPQSFGLEASDGPLPAALARILLPLVMDLVLQIQEVIALLNVHVFDGGGGAGTGPTIRELLDRVAFSSDGLGGFTFDAGILDTDQLLDRLLRLAANVAGQAPALSVPPLTVEISQRPDGTGGADVVYGVALSLRPGERLTLADGNVRLDLEVDASWISGAPADEGIVVELLRVPANGVPTLSFALSVRGVGIRLGKADGPLLDSFVDIDTVALHALATVTPTTGVTAVGGQLELGNLAIPLGSSGGSNRVAAGILRDSASGGQKPEPRFSPALAVQSHGGRAAEFDLRAGPGDGPWWISLQRGFGPVYIEQVGFGVTRQSQTVVAARVVVDGRVSFLGLTIAVDDLSVGARWPRSPGDPPLYKRDAWEVGLAGLGVSAEVSGVSISGALRRSPGELPDYLGMISLRFSVYAITAYGGYAVVSEGGQEYTSLFIFGALNAPLGGPPAFFVTGIGAGVGINRQLLIPQNMAEFPQYPLLKALDRTSPMADPGTALDMLRKYFPSRRGAFWFAAGISFNSFSLVDGIAVIAVAIGDGLDISLLGLARAALPNAAAPLVQVELALVARFSTRDQVLWIQAQLTDNSFLLTRDCRLTGGFAYVMWFGGERKGEFVLTLGGYHPSFRREGYPVVPKLGFVWGVSDALVIKGESYFALTSDALMAGTRFEASLSAGPLWAYLRLGADGIVYFDPFRFQVTAYAELGAGITIEVDLGFLGTISKTFSVHLHADVLLEGPEFRGRATIDLDVASATISFGDWSDHSTPVLGWPAFEAKYVRPGGAAVLTAVPGRGTLPPSPAGNRKAPTGGPADPFLVLPEFVLTLTSTAASSQVNAGGVLPLPGLVLLAIGPMHLGEVTSTLRVSLRAPDGTDLVGRLAPAATLGRFPRGVWAAQPQGEPRPVPTGETVEAVNGVTLTAEANVSVGTVPVDYHRVEVGKRHPLPFLAERGVRHERAADVSAAAQLVALAPAAADDVLQAANAWMTRGANGAAFSPLAAAAWLGGRAAPPQLVPLTFRMAADPPPPVAVPPAPPAPPRPPLDTRAHPPRVQALLTLQAARGETPRARTSVGLAAGAVPGSASVPGPSARLAAAAGPPRIAPPRLAEVTARLDPRLAARLVIAAPPAARAAETVVAAGRVPATARAGGGGEMRRGPGQAPRRADRLEALGRALAEGGADLAGGELAVLAAPNGERDVRTERPSLAIEGDLPVRVVAMDTAGAVTLDATLTRGTVELPPRTDRVALVGGAAGGGAPGWHSGARLAQVGAGTALGAGCTVRTGGISTLRGGVPVSAGLVVAADAVLGYAVVTTRLPAGVNSVAVVLEGGGGAEGARGDALDLGLEGARTAVDAAGAPLPPTTIVAGGRAISVYAIVPDGPGVPVEVTVAAGEHLHLGGVVGGRAGAAALADALARRDAAAVLGTLVDVPAGRAWVRWVPQRTPDVPQSDRPSPPNR